MSYKISRCRAEFGQQLCKWCGAGGSSSFGWISCGSPCTTGPELPMDFRRSTAATPNVVVGIPKSPSLLTRRVGEIDNLCRTKFALSHMDEMKGGVCRLRGYVVVP